MNRAQKFYETVFNVKLTELPTPGSLENDMTMMSFPGDMDGDGAGGVLVKMAGFNAGGNSTLVYFRSDDCSVEKKELRKPVAKFCKASNRLVSMALWFQQLIPKEICLEFIQ